MGNPNGTWWFERRGKLEHAEIVFDAKALRTGLEVIANKLSRKLDDAHPLLNAQLPDGSRLAAVLPPVVRPNPAVTIRKFSKTSFTIADLIQTGAMTPEIGATLSGYIEAGKTMLISGGTGSGKDDSLLNALADYIPEEERIVVIEDTSELRIGKPNLLASECQTESHTGSGELQRPIEGCVAVEARPHHPGRGARRRSPHAARFVQYRPCRFDGDDSRQLCGESTPQVRRIGDAFAPAIEP